MGCHPALLALARGDTPTLSGDEADEDALIDQAIEHRVATLLYRGVTTGELTFRRAGEQRLAMTDLFVRDRFRVSQSTLSDVVSVASEAGFQLATVKGLTNAARWWADDPSARFVSDIDIALAPGDGPNVGALLRALDPAHPLADVAQVLLATGQVTTFALQNRRQLVELHRDALGLTVRPRDAAGIWASTLPMTTTAGGTVRVLDPTLACLQAIVNSAKDNYALLQQVIEIGRMLRDPAIDWDRFSYWAQRQGWNDFVLDGVSWVASVTGSPLPPVRLPRTWSRRLLSLTSPHEQRLGGRVAWRRAQRFAKLDLGTSGRRFEAVAGMARRAATPAPVIQAFAPDLRGPYLVNAARFWVRRQAYVKGSRPTLGPLA